MRPLVYSVGDVLKLLRTSRSSFYRLVNSGQLRTRRLNGRRIVLVKDLDAFLDALSDDLGPCPRRPPDPTAPSRLQKYEGGDEN